VAEDMPYPHQEVYTAYGSAEKLAVDAVIPPELRRTVQGARRADSLSAARKSLYLRVRNCRESLPSRNASDPLRCGGVVRVRTSYGVKIGAWSMKGGKTAEIARCGICW